MLIVLGIYRVLCIYKEWKAYYKVIYMCIYNVKYIATVTELAFT